MPGVPITIGIKGFEHKELKEAIHWTAEKM